MEGQDSEAIDSRELLYFLRISSFSYFYDLHLASLYIYLCIYLYICVFRICYEENESQEPSS